ncbi:MAG: metallophosphoesterase [SAR324 cluster bacterium]|nr:metallophosphoesterase [SAR324 cluster bacterium]
MYIIQISDLHISLALTESEDRANVCQEFEKLIPCIQKESPDLLIVSGDLAAKVPELNSYRYLKQTLSNLGIPWVALKGNHDRGTMFDAVFADNFSTGFQCWKEWSYASILFFDTSAESLPQIDLQALKDFLSQSSHPVYLFTHYPPIAVGYRFFDEECVLPWRDSFYQILSESVSPLHIFFGHIHYEFEFHWKHTHFYSVPSATLPIIPNVSHHTLDKKGPYFRKIMIGQDTFDTSVWSTASFQGFYTF